MHDAKQKGNPSTFVPDDTSGDINNFPILEFYSVNIKLLLLNNRTLFRGGNGIRPTKQNPFAKSKRIPEHSMSHII